MPENPSRAGLGPFEPATLGGRPCYTEPVLHGFGEMIMANLTITVPEEILKSARRRALEQGTSVNALLRDYLRQFTNAQPTQAKAAARVLELSRKSRAGRGKARWTRDDLHQR